MLKRYRSVNWVYIVEVIIKIPNATGRVKICVSISCLFCNSNSISANPLNVVQYTEKAKKENDLLKCLMIWVFESCVSCCSTSIV